SMIRCNDNQWYNANEDYYEGVECISDSDCDDGNECTDNECNGGVCEYVDSADDTACSGGICCAGSCGAPVCENNADCDDSNTCSEDTCNDGGTCVAQCTYDTETECIDSDGCCPTSCSYLTDNDCDEAEQCWDKDDQYLYYSSSQFKKFCLCAEGEYDYDNYHYAGYLDGAKYLDTGNNENWETEKTKNSMADRIECNDDIWYYTNRNYYLDSDAECFNNNDCDDGNGCTDDECNGGVCEYPGSADDTACSGGICCAGSCGAPVCENNAGCDDNNTCSEDTCSNAGTCNAECTYDTETSCIDSDGCCPASCDYLTDNDCSQAELCWDKDDEYLYWSTNQFNKFCLCAEGTYGYSSYQYGGYFDGAKYSDTGNNENWETEGTKYSMANSLKCKDGNWYNTNRNYYFDSDAECFNNDDCEDEDSCTVDTCVANECVEDVIDTCDNDDQCCPTACDYTTDNDCEQGDLCWEGDNTYIRKDSDDLKKLCKCIIGDYNYASYNYYDDMDVVYQYKNDDNNENWAVEIREDTDGVYQIRCKDYNWYDVNVDYYYT
ncbi:MAG: hypothetical protein ABIG89_02365, partial [Candidatus Woesearchaeota archaeon]